MLYGYARVSTTDQRIDRQIAALTAAGVPEENVYIDKLSGKDFNREAYQQLTGADNKPAMLQEGDCLVLLSLDRLGRNYGAIQDEWRRITQDLKADIKILDMPLLDTSKSSESLDSRFMASLVLEILAYVAAKERTSLLERQRGGIEAARLKGVYDKENHRGRTRTSVNLKAFESAYQQFTGNAITIKQAAEVAKLPEYSLRRRFKEREQIGEGYNPNEIPA